MSHFIQNTVIIESLSIIMIAHKVTLPGGRQQGRGCARPGFNLLQLGMSDFLSCNVRLSAAGARVAVSVLP